MVTTDADKVYLEIVDRGFSVFTQIKKNYAKVKSKLISFI